MCRERDKPAEGTSERSLGKRPLSRRKRNSTAKGLVTLTDSNARWRNQGDGRHMRFQYLTVAGRADPKAEIGENCPNVTSPLEERQLGPHLPKALQPCMGISMSSPSRAGFS